MNNESKVKALDDQLAELDPPYESEGEARIGHLLDKYGIPFFYRQATIIPIIISFCAQHRCSDICCG